MTRQGRLDPDLGRLVIPDLSHQDDIGILPQERSQGRGEVQPYLIVHLDLVDPHEVKLYRVLSRHDVHVFRIEIRQGRIKCRGFTAPGGPRDKDHPERFVDRINEVGQGLLLESQFGHVQLQVGLVQEPEHDLLTEKGGKDRYPEVDLGASPQFHLDPAVLG